MFAVPKPTVGHNLDNIPAPVQETGPTVYDQNKKDTQALINAAMTANGGNTQDPTVQIAIAESSSAENHAIVTTALENATSDSEEDKAIEKISH
jgi:hypothetical protein